MGDILSQIDSDRNILEKLLSKIPGFSGYMEREKRREADKLLRDEIVRRYGLQLARLNDIPVAMLESGQFTLLDDLDRARTRLQTFIDRVRTASYGYSGFFDAVKINEDELAKLYNFDAALLEGEGKLSSAIDAVVAEDRDAVKIGTLITETDALNETFLQRDSVIKGV